MNKTRLNSRRRRRRYFRQILSMKKTSLTLKLKITLPSLTAEDNQASLAKIHPQSPMAMATMAMATMEMKRIKSHSTVSI